MLTVSAPAFKRRDTHAPTYIHNDVTYLRRHPLFQGVRHNVDGILRVEHVPQTVTREDQKLVLGLQINFLQSHPIAE